MLGPTRASCLRFLSLESAIGDALKNRVEWLLEYHAGRYKQCPASAMSPRQFAKAIAMQLGFSLPLYIYSFFSSIRAFACVSLSTTPHIYVRPSQLWLLLQGRWSYFCARRPHQLIIALLGLWAAFVGHDPTNLTCSLPASVFPP